MIEKAFAGKDPETAQFYMEVESYARLLADLKPRFIHHPPSKERIREDARRYRLRPGSDILQRPADSKLDVRQLPDVGHRLRLSSPPRHLVHVPDTLAHADEFAPQGHYALNSLKMRSA
jgi:hypothetical protein